MNISFNKKTPTEATITVNIEVADYRDLVAEKIKSYSKKASLQASLQGRPGKAPISVIQRLYGRSIFADEVNRLLHEAITKYLEENKIHVLGQPILSQNNIEQIDGVDQKDVEFLYTIGMAGPLHPKRK